ncbi:hypothetical protein OE88DRAFT_1654590 [Heliocybe sulcata]|uniref:Uncharacterized protein n=1 Tax=Heliocybe sulcata TaxID=5364 RepID=A0A5C3N8S5_9AGAM|nr:hypothetical protein OE88DRAFT_1654590 [Heliocybe sulcata]
MLTIRTGKKSSWRKRKTDNQFVTVSLGADIVPTLLTRFAAEWTMTLTRTMEHRRFTWIAAMPQNETMRQILTSRNSAEETPIQHASSIVIEPKTTPAADEEEEEEEPSQPEPDESQPDSGDAEESVEHAESSEVRSPQLSYPQDLPEETIPIASPEPQPTDVDEREAAAAVSQPSDTRELDSSEEEGIPTPVDAAPRLEGPASPEEPEHPLPEDSADALEGPLAEVAVPSPPSTPRPLKPITQHITPRLPPLFRLVDPEDSLSVQEPIEDVEDLPEFETRMSMEIQDPIEAGDEDEDEKGNERSPNPVHNTPKPGVAKRMKNRFGHVPFPALEDVEDPLLSLQVVCAEEPDGMLAQAPVLEETVGSRMRGTRRKSVPTVSEPSVVSNQPEEPPVTEPKPRGRKPLSEEEKTRRAAARQAEREYKARLKKEKQEQARAAKEAEKVEKATQRKANGAASKRGRKVTVVPVEEEEEPAGDVTVLPKNESIMVPGTPPLDNTQSLAQWATLEPSQSEHGFAQSESSIDQLHPSSPDTDPRGTKASSADIDGIQALVLNTSGESRDSKSAAESPPRQVPDDSPPTEPLFLPSETQSQAVAWHKQQGDNDVVLPSSFIASESEAEREGELAIPHPVKSALPASQPTLRPSVAPYRRLTDIASSQASLFPRPSGNLPPAMARKSRAKEELSQMYPDDDEESDDDDSDEDEAKERKSHIPKNRRAGSGVGISSGRRTGGLLRYL